MGTKQYKPTVIILGKLPPPFYGPAIATEILINSDLKNYFNIIHIDTRLNQTMSTFGRFGLGKICLLTGIFSRYIQALRKTDSKIVLIPIAQGTSGLIKDSIFIIFARIYSKSVILHLRGSSLLTWYENRGYILKKYFKWIFSGCSAGIVLGEKLKYIFAPFFPSSKIFVVPNGANFAMVNKNRTGPEVSVLYFGNLQASKGIEDVISAVSALSEAERSVMLLKVVGSWRNEGLKNGCLSVVNRLDLPVKFFEPMSGVEKNQVFADTDIFIFTPREPEGHPWVIIEAMAAGLPVITTDQGAITESVFNDVNGYIVNTLAPLEISDKLKYLIKNPEERIKMGRESRRIYEKYFTEEIMVNKLKFVFDTVNN